LWRQTLLKAGAVFLIFDCLQTHQEAAMRLIHTSLLVGAAVLGLGAFALPVVGKDLAIHEMTVQLPGGGSETIQYAGEVVPKVRFDRDPFLLAWSSPVALSFGPSFADFDRIGEDLDYQMNAFWRQVDTMARWPQSQTLSQVGLQNLLPGASAYSVVSESFGNNVCTRTTEITTPPDGGKPKVVSQTSGNCSESPGGALMVSPSTPSGAKSIAVHSAIQTSSAPRTAL
jgi:hypothetical protein